MPTTQRYTDKELLRNECEPRSIFTGYSLCICLSIYIHLHHPSIREIQVFKCNFNILHLPRELCFWCSGNCTTESGDTFHFGITNNGSEYEVMMNETVRDVTLLFLPDQLHLPSNVYQNLGLCHSYFNTHRQNMWNTETQFPAVRFTVSEWIDVWMCLISVTLT